MRNNKKKKRHVTKGGGNPDIPKLLNERTTNIIED